jgi:FkbM family methyltransferase
VLTAIRCMNLFDCIYPLRLRGAVFFRLLSRGHAWPKVDPTVGFSLALAPVAIRTLHRTDISHRSIAWTGFDELDLSRCVARLARRGGILVDAGANVGYFTLLWASMSHANQVIAFEPSPRNFRMLESNVNAAGLGSRVRMCPVALGRKMESMLFDPGPEHQTGWGGLRLSAAERSFPVTVQTLDQIMEGVERITVLKIDTEGADAWVLEGAATLLREHRIEHVFCEINVSRMRKLSICQERPRQFLESYGYAVTPVGRSPFELHGFLPN